MKNPFTGMTPLKALGALLAVCGAYMAFQFGRSLASGWDGFWTGVAFAGFAGTAYFMLDKSFDFYEQGRTGRGHIAAAVFLGCALINSIGTWSFSATNRISTSTGAEVVNARYEGATASVAESEGMFQKLDAAVAAIDKANGWAATTTADGLRAQLGNIESGKLFKRSKSCSNVTLADSKAMCDERTSVMERIAVVEERSQLQVKRDAAKHAVDDARAKRDALPKEIASATVSKNIIAAAFTGEMKPTEVAGFWSTLGLAALVAFMLEFMPGVINALSRNGRAASLMEFTEQKTAPLAKPATPVHPFKLAKPEVVENHHHHNTVQVFDPLSKILGPLHKVAA